VLVAVKQKLTPSCNLVTDELCTLPFAAAIGA